MLVDVLQHFDKVDLEALRWQDSICENFKALDKGLSQASACKSDSTLDFLCFFTHLAIVSSGDANNVSSRNANGEEVKYKANLATLGSAPPISMNEQLMALDRDAFPQRTQPGYARRKGVLIPYYADDVDQFPPICFTYLINNAHIALASVGKFSEGKAKVSMNSSYLKRIRKYHIPDCETSESEDLENQAQDKRKKNHQENESFKTNYACLDRRIYYVPFGYRKTKNLVVEKLQYIVPMEQLHRLFIALHSRSNHGGRDKMRDLLIEYNLRGPGKGLMTVWASACACAKTKDKKYKDTSQTRFKKRTAVAAQGTLATQLVMPEKKRTKQNTAQAPSTRLQAKSASTTRLQAQLGSFKALASEHGTDNSPNVSSGQPWESFAQPSLHRSTSAQVPFPVAERPSDSGLGVYSEPPAVSVGLRSYPNWQTSMQGIPNAGLNDLSYAPDQAFPNLTSSSQNSSSTYPILGPIESPVTPFSQVSLQAPPYEVSLQAPPYNVSLQAPPYNVSTQAPPYNVSPQAPPYNPVLEPQAPYPGRSTEKRSIYNPGHAGDYLAAPNHVAAAAGFQAAPIDPALDSISGTGRQAEVFDNSQIMPYDNSFSFANEATIDPSLLTTAPGSQAREHMTGFASTRGDLDAIPVKFAEQVLDENTELGAGEVDFDTFAATEADLNLDEFFNFGDEDDGQGTSTGTSSEDPNPPTHSDPVDTSSDIFTSIAIDPPQHELDG